VTVTTRRDRREKQKRAPGRRRSGGGGGGRMNPLVVGGVVAIAFVLLVLGLRQAGVFEPPPPPPPTLPPGETIGTLQPDEGTAHIPVGQIAHYNTEPPTSGEHWSSSTPPAPAPWGVKDAMLPREITTHNLEHGGIVIAYNGLSPQEVDQLKSLVTQLRRQYNKIVLEPFPPLTDAKVAITSWRWLLKLPGIDQTKLTQFVQKHYADPNYAPEANIP